MQNADSDLAYDRPSWHLEEQAERLLPRHGYTFPNLKAGTLP